MASPGSHHPARSMVQEFPQPGRLLQHAYRELDLALNGTDEQRAALGDLRVLPRPWDPDSLKGAALRRELWDWLEAANGNDVSTPTFVYELREGLPAAVQR